MINRVVNQARTLMKAGMPIVVFDLETTGLNRLTDRILSFSAVRVRLGDGIWEEVDRIDLFINPGFPIPEKVTEINHITDDRVADCPKEAEAAKIIREYLGNRPMVGGYNSVNFDAGFMESMYQRVFGEGFKTLLHLDVMQMAKEKLSLPSYKLAAVSAHLEADGGLEFHNSIDDVLATVRCMGILFDRFPEEDVRLYETVEPEKTTVKVIGAKYWQPRNGGNMSRIYVQSNPDAGIFYDVTTGNWRCRDEAVDLDKVRADVLEHYHCTDELALVRIMRR